MQINFDGSSWIYWIFFMGGGEAGRTLVWSIQGGGRYNTCLEYFRIWKEFFLMWHFLENFLDHYIYFCIKFISFFLLLSLNTGEQRLLSYISPWSSFALSVNFCLGRNLHKVTSIVQWPLHLPSQYRLASTCSPLRAVKNILGDYSILVTWSVMWKKPFI